MGQAGRSPFHIVPGPVKEGAESWLCADGTVIRSITYADREEWCQWRDWLKYKASEDGAKATDERALACMERDGAIIGQTA